MPNGDSPATTPDNEATNLVVRPSMTDNEIRDVFRKAYFALQEDARVEFLSRPGEKTLDAFKGVLKEAFDTADDQFRPRFEQLKAEVVEEIASKLMPDSTATPPVYVLKQVEAAPTSQNVAKGADPVELFSGNFVYQANDLQINGAGFDFAFVRTYSQLSPYAGALGSNWDHCCNLWLRVEPDSKKIHRSTGTLAEEIFTKHEQFDYWTPPAGSNGVLREQGGSFVLRLPNGARVVYRLHPTLHPFIHIAARTEDRFGNGIDFEYVDGRLDRLRVNHPDRIVEFEYDTLDRIIAIRDHTGRTWRYDYDDLGNLAAVTTPGTPAYKAGLTTMYEYTGPLEGDPDLQHNLVKILDAAGQLYLENQYGTERNLVSYQRVIRQRQGSGETLFDYADVIEEFEFQYSDRERPARQTIVTERDGRQIRYLFNRFGNMIFKEEYARIGGLPKLVSSHYRYNRDGNLIGSISPLGVITQALFGRDLYERRFPQQPDATEDADPNLTETARLQFDNLLAVVKRGRYHDFLSLNLSHGLWAADILPDIFDTNEDDVIQKFTYEPKFAQVATVSDPRVTRSADPAFSEGPDYTQRLARFTYSQDAAQHLLLQSIELPTPTLPDGQQSDPVETRFPDYDNRGRPIRIITPNGLEVVNVYAGSADGILAGFLKTKTFDPGGLAITKGMERDSLGRAVRVLRPPHFDGADDRFFSSFDYNALNQVVRSTSTAPFSITTRTTYNRVGGVARSEVELKNEEMAPTGSVIMTNRYDEENHIVQQTIGDGTSDIVKQTKVVFDYASRPFLTINPSGRKQKTRFNERALAAQIIEDYGGVHAITRIYYDADGRLARILDPRGASTRLEYDALGRLVDTEDAQGNRIIRHFDKIGNLLVECRYERAATGDFRLLARREFAYDELGRLIAAGVNRFEQPPSLIAAQVGQAFRLSGPGELLTIQSFYDNIGNLVKQVDHDGRAFTSEYDLLGRPIRKTDPNGNELTFTYDKEGNVLRVDRKEVTHDPATNAITATRHFAEAFAYDELNRLIERKTVTGRLRNRYDSRGNPVEVEDPLGNKSRNRYDVFGRLTENMQLFQKQTEDEPVAVRTSFTYDRDDRKTSQTDAMGRRTHLQYDTAGRLTAIVLPDGSSDLATYDRAGNLIGYRDRNGLMRQMEWDELSRPTQLHVAAPTTGFVGATSYRAEYDGLGRFKRVENDFTVHRFRYNSLDHLLEETTSFTGVTGLDPARKFVVGRTFSNSSLLTGLTYPSGREIRFARDVLDRVTKVLQVAKGSGYPGDPGIADNFAIADIDYEGLQVKRIARANGITTTFRHDFGGRPVEISHAEGANPVLASQQLHDAVGNIRQQTELSSDFESTGTYDYDSLSRLFRTRWIEAASLQDLSPVAPSKTPLPEPLPDRQPEIDALLSAGSAMHTDSYDYDLTGNRVTKTLDDAEETYETNERDQYTSVGGADLHYDSNGNLAEDDTFWYAYDYRNQLTRIIRKADGHQTDLFRDYFGRECVQREGSQLKITIHDGRNILEQYGAGQLLRSVVSNTEQDGIIVSASGGRDSYLLADLTGSVRYLYDAAGRRNFYVYDEFGNLQQSLVPSDDNIFRFCGKRLVGNTGKYDFVFRVYDPSQGRFIQPDPSGYVDGPNLYVYGKNNPLALRDPNGLESRPEQTVNSALYTARALAIPVDRSGRPLKGTYNLWSGQVGQAQARQAPGWIMEQTPQHAAAEILEQDFYAKNPGQQMPRDVFEDIWVGRSKMVARRAVLGGMPVASWGLNTHPNPTRTVQFQYEIPTVQSYGAISALGMKAGGLLNIWAAAHVDNPYVKGIGLTAGAVETFGGTLYFGGALTQETSMMALGSNFARFGGGIGLTVVSGYTFVHDVEKGNVRDAIGSGANTATGITMLVTSNPWALAATGTFAVSYNGSRWIAKETGWGQTSGKVGAGVANFIMGDDPGALRKGAGYTVGFAVTAGGVLVVEPLAFAGKKLGQGAWWVGGKVASGVESAYDWATDLIGYEFDF